MWCLLQPHILVVVLRHWRVDSRQPTHKRSSSSVTSLHIPTNKNKPFACRCCFSCDFSCGNFKTPVQPTYPIPIVLLSFFCNNLFLQNFQFLVYMDCMVHNPIIRQMERIWLCGINTVLHDMIRQFVTLWLLFIQRLVKYLWYRASRVSANFTLMRNVPMFY